MSGTEIAFWSGKTHPIEHESLKRVVSFGATLVITNQEGNYRCVSGLVGPIISVA